MTETARRYALVWCSEDERIDYRQEMIGAFRLGAENWDVLSPFTDPLERALEKYDAFVISGSEYSVNDDAAWIQNLFGLIRAIAERDIPLVGICFGSQAIACALGGQVGPNPDGEFYFNVECLQPSARLQQWLQSEGLPVPRVIESHGECVLVLPSGATWLAGSALTRVEMFALTPRILGIQGHPEISKSTALDKFLPVHRELGHIDKYGSAQLIGDLEKPLETQALITAARQVLSGSGFHELDNEA